MHPHEPYRLAVANQKGGVGKSTLTLNVAGALASVGHDVLVVDMDPNGHLTVALEYKDRYTDTERPSLYTALTGDFNESSDLVVSCTEFDFIPSNIQLFGLERELISMRQGEFQLRKTIDTLVANDPTAYDFIIVDSPPSLGLLTDNAIVATERIIVPVGADETSTHALELLVNQVDVLEDTYDVNIEHWGIVIMNVVHPPDGEERTMIEWFHDTFDDSIGVYEIRKRVKINRAWNNAVSLLEHDESDWMEDNLYEIANDLAADAVEVAHAN